MITTRNFYYHSAKFNYAVFSIKYRFSVTGIFPWRDALNIILDNMKTEEKRK